MTFPHNASGTPSPEEIPNNENEEDAPHAGSGVPAHAALKRGLFGFSLFRRPAHTPRKLPGTVASVLAVLAALIAPAFVAGLSLLGGNAPGGARSAAATLHKGPHVAQGAINGNSADAADRLAAAAGDPQLPPATTPPAPAPPSLASAPPLTPHEVFGFAPYWTLTQEGGFNVAGISTIAYFSLDVNADGSVQTSGAGWDGYNSQALSDLITRAHAAGVRVVLTVNDFDQSSLDKLTSSPTAPQTLASALVPLVANKNFDGVNLDFEGQGSADQTGLTNLVTHVSSALKSVNSHYQVTMDTYASSAAGNNGFYNLSALAPAVDAFFVMAYNLNVNGSPSATSPLTSGQFSDATAVDEYAASVPPSKVILGLPFYGLDWATTDGTLTAQAQGPSTPVSIAQVLASGHPIYWDNTTSTGWTSYQVGAQWHETFFETPTSFYLAAAMAQNHSLAGVGMWALGMDGNDPADLSALLGFAPAVKGGPVGPAVTSMSPPTTSTTAPSTTSTTQAGSGTTSTTTKPPTSSTTHPGSGTTTTTPPTTSTSSPGSGTTTTPPPTTSTSTPGSGTTTTSPPASTTPSSSTTTTSPPPTPPTPTAFTFGTWNGTAVQLTAVAAGTAPPQAGSLLGQLTGFTTSDPAAACLAAEPSLNVYAVVGDASEFLVQATMPTDCATEDFVFTVP